MKRWIEESDCNRAAFESFIKLFKVALLHWFDLSKSSFSFFNSIGADHFTECSDSVSFKEHMLCTAKTDTFSTEFTSLLSVSRCISVCSYLKNSVLISPSHDSAEFTCDSSINCWDDAVVDVTCRTIDRNVITFVECLSGECELLVFFIHYDVGAT